MSTPFTHLKHKAEIDKPCRFEIWKQKLNTEGRPWRRRHDGKYGFVLVNTIRSHMNPRSTWISLLLLYHNKPQNALRVQTFYDRHYRERVIQVFIGTRTFLREHFQK